MNEPQVPPGVLAGLDQRIAECGRILDGMVGGFRKFREVVNGDPEHMTAELAMWLQESASQMPDHGTSMLLDLLTVAVDRLANHTCRCGVCGCDSCEPPEGR